MAADILLLHPFSTIQLQLQGNKNGEHAREAVSVCVVGGDSCQPYQGTVSLLGNGSTGALAIRFRRFLHFTNSFPSSTRIHPVAIDILMPRLGLAT